MLVYHGSNVVVSEPQILLSKYRKDFGAGFYCTTLKSQAERWALRKATGEDDAIISIFEYSPDENLAIKSFRGLDDEWLEIIAAGRSGRLDACQPYDIIEGPMADDTVWDYVADYLDGNISKAAFRELTRFRHPTHQIAFVSQRALTTLRFLRWESAFEEDINGSNLK